jgi:hypothetical protein
LPVDTRNADWAKDVVEWHQRGRQVDLIVARADIVEGVAIDEGRLSGVEAMAKFI